MPRWLAIPLLLLLIGCADPDTPNHPDDSSTFVFEVPQGASARAIGPALQKAGLVSSQWKWKLYLHRNPDEAACLKAGKFRLEHDMSVRQAMAAMCGVPLSEDVSFTVVEGWRIRDIDAALAAQGLIEPGAYQALADSESLELPFPIDSPSLEGYLYPETYEVPPPGHFDCEAFIERQLHEFDTLFRQPHADDFGKHSLKDVVIVASMVEREEGNPAERPVVAGILWKRLDHGWQLGVDATSRYSLAEWNDRKAFLKKLRDPDDPYNTRLNKGLPPTAIGNPSLSSLEAALKPVDSDYWYYLHDKDGVLHGARTSAEHEANRKKYDVY